MLKGWPEAKPGEHKMNLFAEMIRQSRNAMLKRMGWSTPSYKISFGRPFNIIEIKAGGNCFFPTAIHVYDRGLSVMEDQP